jgi:hypothetical protein
MSKSLLLKRFIKSPVGVFGVLNCNDEVIAFTAELPDLNNQTKISCIPEGVFLCKRYSSEKHPNTFEVTGVTGRDFILFHTGNIPLHDSQGCILLGLQVEIIGTEWSVLTSKDAFAKFMDFLKDEQTFQLAIKYV